MILMLLLVLSDHFLRELSDILAELLLHFIMVILLFLLLDHLAPLVVLDIRIFLSDFHLLAFNRQLVFLGIIIDDLRPELVMLLVRHNANFLRCIEETR